MGPPSWWGLRGAKLWPHNPTLIAFGLCRYCFIRSQTLSKCRKATLSFWRSEGICKALSLHCRRVLPFMLSTIHTTDVLLFLMPQRIDNHGDWQDRFNIFSSLISEKHSLMYPHILIYCSGIFTKFYARLQGWHPSASGQLAFNSGMAGMMSIVNGGWEDSEMPALTNSSVWS